MTNPPPLHMHGSNLLVRSDIEDSIGWNFGPTLAEDQIFGYKIYEKYGPKSMGWHGGMLLEQPPLNIKDHFMQRRRWVLGSLQNMVRFPLIHKFKLMFKLVTYFMGFVSGVVSTILYFDAYIPKVLLVLSISISEFNLDIISWFDMAMKTFSSEATINASINGGPLDPIIGLILLFPYTMWLFSYQLGLFLNLRYSKISLIKRVALHLQTLLLSVVIGLLETFPAFYAMLEYYLRGKTNRMKKIYDFYVIKK
jgi:cellulose synthase/poly-beta-1,6-N-acetylglucosamine synthase-like glycosyltransferase